MDTAFQGTNKLNKFVDFLKSLVIFLYSSKPFMRHLAAILQNNLYWGNLV